MIKIILIKKNTGGGNILTDEQIARAKKLIRTPFVQVSFDGKVELQPSIILYHYAFLGYPKFTGSVKSYIKDMRNKLEKNNKLLTTYKDQLKDYPAFTDDLLEELIEKSQTNKYKTRDSPAYTAKYFCNMIFKGNDGNDYIGVKTKNSCVWKKK
jgi:hypothetical protein